MFLFKELCFVILSLHTVMGIPSGKIAPKETYVIDGDAAIFTCTVVGRNNEEIVWEGSVGESVVWSYSATSFTVLQDSVGYLEKATFTNAVTVYNASYTEEVFKLRIDLVTNSDYDKLQISCFQPETGVLDSANLTVLSRPQCEYYGSLPSVIEEGNNFAISLLCNYMQVGFDYTLTWYKLDRNQLIEISDPITTNSAAAFSTMTIEDYGREFVCQAKLDLLPNKALSCSVVPYKPIPSLSLFVHASSKESISVECFNTGAHNSNTSYIWYNDGVLFNTDIEGISFSHTITSSTIIVSKSVLSFGNHRITCEAVIPSVSRSNSSVLITIDNLSGAMTTPSTKDEVPARAKALIEELIATAAIGWCLFILVLLCLIGISCLVYWKRGKFMWMVDDKRAGNAMEMTTSLVNNDALAGNDGTLPRNNTSTTTGNAVTTSTIVDVTSNNNDASLPKSGASLAALANGGATISNGTVPNTNGDPNRDSII